MRENLVNDILKSNIFIALFQKINKKQHTKDNKR